MVRFKNTARAKEAKAIMTAPHILQRTRAPIFSRAAELFLWFAQSELDRFPSGLNRKNQRTFRASVSAGVSQQFQKCFLQNLRIDLEDFIA